MLSFMSDSCLFCCYPVCHTILLRSLRGLINEKTRGNCNLNLEETFPQQNHLLNEIRVGIWLGDEKPQCFHCLNFFLHCKPLSHSCICILQFSSASIYPEHLPMRIVVPVHGVLYEYQVRIYLDCVKLSGCDVHIYKGLRVHSTSNPIDGCQRQRLAISLEFGRL